MKIVKIERRWAWLRKNGDVDVCLKGVTRKWMRTVKKQLGSEADGIVRVKVTVLK